MPKYTPTKLTIRFVENLPPAERDERGRVLSYSVRDTLVPGLMVVVNSNSKSFAVQRDFYAQERDASGRRIKLGTRRVRLGDAQQFLSIEAVRAKAAEVIASLKAGIDPNTKAPAQEVAQPAPAPAYTLGDAIDAYVEVCQRKGRRPSTISGYEKLARRYLQDWVGRPLEEVGNDPLGVDRLHRDITRDHGPVAANQTMRLIRAVYRSAARKRRDLPPCPTDAVDFNEERRRTLVVTDWAKFFDTVDGLRNPVTRSFYYFLALTGCRKGAAEAARVEHINWERGFIHIPDPKGGPKRAFDLPLGNRLLALLRAQVEDNKAVFGANYPWLFPSHFSSKGRITQAAVRGQGLVNPHAIRHSWASCATAAGLNPYEIKLILNHVIVDGATGTYLHSSAMGDALRKAAQRVEDYIFTRAGRNVVSLEAARKAVG